MALKWAMLKCPFAAVVLGLAVTTQQVSSQETRPFTVETVAEGLEVPWAMAWDPTGRLLVTERPGRVRAIRDGKLLEKPVFEVDDIRTGGGGEIGLMGICLHPEFASNGFLYVAYGDKKEKDVRVVRLKQSATGSISEDKVIVKGVPASANHAGCAIKFGPDKKLYITCGEAFRRQLAIDMNSLGGKTLRVNDDGSIPDDNPFVGDKRARAEIWSFGHRNAQGMDWNEAGVMFQSEHGPSGEVGTGAMTR